MAVDLVVGLTRRTSYSLIRSLLLQGRKVVVSDLSDTSEKQEILQELFAYGNVTDRLGNQSIELLNEFDIERVLPSPGVPRAIPLIRKAVARGIAVMGDIEVFYRQYPDLVYAAVTGTDGKSTTVSLLEDIVIREKSCMATGNIGTAVFEAEERVGNIEVLVLELSSFQLETIVNFRPQVAALLNFAEDHLDRYDSFKSYREAKLRVFKNQTAEDVAVLNKDDDFFEECRKQTNAKVLTFSLKDPSADAWFDGESLMLKVRGEILLNRKDLRLPGIHNVANALAAALIAGSLGVSLESIRESLRTFKGLEHRMEKVRELDGVVYYNDSKATTVNAVEKALLSFDSPILLIAGGRDKDLDFKRIASLVKQKVKRLILIGEAAEKIQEAWQDVKSEDVGTMERAVFVAREIAKKGDVVLLSPGCASFDQFKSYTERGSVFKQKVNALK